MLKERTQDYDDDQLAELAELIVDIAVPLRAEYFYRIEFLVLAKEFLSTERSYYVFRESNRIRQEQIQPVVDFIKSKLNLSNPRTLADLGVLKTYYLRLEDPAAYPKLHPKSATMNCFNDPTARGLQQDIINILKSSGAPGAELLDKIVYERSHPIQK
ncbi:MAG: hypothetical protein L3K26_03440 [Candidatus Hydrogenedentes bacterium]|nr:hypothetical protein [Candidatus Hydrogenedentota bacterium]